MDNAGSNSQPQRSVKLAIDCETGELVPADALLAMPESEFTALRRAAMAARRERRRGGDAVRYQCALCKHPLFLSRWIEGLQNRWFVHDGKTEHCPSYEGTRLTPDQVKALVYRGQQEGRPHREMKQFIAKWLATDPLVSEVSQEQTTFSEVLKGERRRPDVKCRYRGLPLVFEVQLSYTFLSDVIARDDFYGSRMDACARPLSNMSICGRMRSPAAPNTKVIATVAKSTGHARKSSTPAATYERFRCLSATTLNASPRLVAESSRAH